jgi:malyl-CoA/(S)-citramalyl-CoA lyase
MHMSFTTIERVPPRLNRSQLFVPGVRPALFEKAALGDADVICLDLEDSVPPADKPQARANVIQALKSVNFGSKSISVRVNGLDTPWAYREIVDILEQAGERLDLIMIPKVGVAADVYAVDMLISQIEMAVGRKKPVKLEVIIESVLGLNNIDGIAGASKRLESLHFGAADYAASAGMRTTNIGGPNKDYVVLTDADAGGKRETHWSDMWHYHIVRMVAAARAHGLRPIDGPFGDYSDEAGFTAQANRTAVLGCEGKWAIHPSQVAPANRIYTPPADEVARAEAILAAMEEGQRKGLAAVSLNGRLIDRASIRQAEVIVRQVQMIRERTKS